MSLSLLSAQILLKSHWWARGLDYGLKSACRQHASVWFPLGQSMPFWTWLKCCTRLLNRWAQASSIASVHPAIERTSSCSLTSERGLIHHLHLGEICCSWHESVNISLANSYCWWGQASLCHKDTSVLLVGRRLQATLCQHNCVSDKQCKDKDLLWGFLFQLKTLWTCRDPVLLLELGAAPQRKCVFISHFAEGITGDPLKPVTSPCLLCCALRGNAWAGSSSCQGDAYLTIKP